VKVVQVLDAKEKHVMQRLVARAGNQDYEELQHPSYSAENADYDAGDEVDDRVDYSNEQFYAWRFARVLHVD